jgi:hypothetical protein
MALIINATETAKLSVQGMNIELTSIYARIKWQCLIDGKSISYGLIPFLDKENYKNENPCPVTFQGGAGGFVLQEGQVQDLQTIHELVKAELEAKGFVVTIDLE